MSSVKSVSLGTFGRWPFASAVFLGLCNALVITQVSVDAGIVATIHHGKSMQVDSTQGPIASGKSSETAIAGLNESDTRTDTILNDITAPTSVPTTISSCCNTPSQECCILTFNIPHLETTVAVSGFETVTESPDPHREHRESTVDPASLDAGGGTELVPELGSLLPTTRTDSTPTATITDATHSAPESQTTQGRLQPAQPAQTIQSLLPTPASTATVLVGSSTLPIAGVSLTVISEGTSSLSPVFILGSQTVQEGQTVLVEGTPVAVELAGARTNIVVGFSTFAWPSAAIVADLATVTQAAIADPILTVNGQTYTADSSGAFVIGTSMTLTPGGAVTLSGTRISLDPSGTAVMIGSSSSLVARPKSTTVDDATGQASATLKAPSSVSGAVDTGTFTTSTRKAAAQKTYGEAYAQSYVAYLLGLIGAFAYAMEGI